MRFALALALSVAVACSGRGASSGSPGDGGADGAFSPAAHPALPQIVSRGGPVLAKPRLVAVTFAGDPLAPRLEAFVDALGKSAYFASAAAEYGVAPASVLSPVRVADAAPAQISDVEVRSWLAGMLSGTRPEFPPAASDLVYVLFYPQGTTISMNGATSCAFSGYHGETPVLSGVTVSFAVVARCTNVLGLPDPFDAATAAASHEILETVADPLVVSRPAFSDTDDDNPAWPLVFNGGEVADLCARSAGAYARAGDLPFTVHRIWSNSASRAGHDPCVPSPSGAYFNSVPVLGDTVTVTVKNQAFRVRGVRIPVGQTRAVDLALFSDARIEGAWSIRALDGPAANGTGPPELALDVSPTSGKNGDVVKLSITVLARGAYGGEPFLVESTLGGKTSYAVGLVGE